MYNSYFEASKIDLSLELNCFDKIEISNDDASGKFCKLYEKIHSIIFELKEKYGYTDCIAGIEIITVIEAVTENKSKESAYKYEKNIDFLKSFLSVNHVFTMDDMKFHQYAQMPMGKFLVTKKDLEAGHLVVVEFFSETKNEN